MKVFPHESSCALTSFCKYSLQSFFFKVDHEKMHSMKASGTPFMFLLSLPSRERPCPFGRVTFPLHSLLAHGHISMNICNTTRKPRFWPSTKGRKPWQPTFTWCGSSLSRIPVLCDLTLSDFRTLNLNEAITNTFYRITSLQTNKQACINTNTNEHAPALPSSQK